MSYQCLNPLIAIKLFEKKDGKSILKFFSKSRFNYCIDDLKIKNGIDNVFVMPCGKCESCRRNYAENWAVRCCLEAQYHKYNYFLTLTYEDHYVDEASHKDIKHFYKALAGRDYKNKFRYFGCTERGELNNRIHHHLILFCDSPLDLRNPVKRGKFYSYHSKDISKAWKFGLHDISPFETNCARYVAKYTNKSDSKIFMSRNIGKQYILDNYNQIIENNFIIYGDFNDKKYTNLPMCFLNLFIADGNKKAIERKEYLKSIARFVHASKARDLKADHEEIVISNDIKRVKDKKTKRRTL